MRMDEWKRLLWSQGTHGSRDCGKYLSGGEKAFWGWGCGPHPTPMIERARTMNNDDPEGYSGVFYIMLLLGIVGLIGFLFVAAGASAGAL